MAVHETTPVKERILSVLVENRAGVLSHVIGLFSARGFNIDSLAVGETEDPTMSRITLVAKVDEKTLEQLKKQLNKLIDVIKIQDLGDEGFIDRELMLVKLKTTPALKKSLEAITREHCVKVIEDGAKITTVECTETRENRKKIFQILKSHDIVEIAQTGAVALSKKAPKE